MIWGCIDPVTPEYELKEGLFFVEGFASTEPGASFVIIKESAFEFGFYVTNFVKGARVSFINSSTREEVELSELIGTYIPPPDFRVAPGASWELDIVLENGTNYRSAPELVLEPVPIVDLEVVYDPELAFREINGGKFIPGHEVLVSFDDPANRKNFYYWTYRTFENLDFCEKCYNAVFRDGECQSLPLSLQSAPYYDYTCESDCWRIRFPEGITIYDDEFSDGKSVSKFSIGELLLYTKENMVVEVQQFTLTPSAHKYYKVLKDIVDNNRSLNAPPPSALVGNLFNPNDPEDFIFGRFTAAASAVRSMFIERTFISEQPLETMEAAVLEPTLNSPLPPPPTTTAPCSETRFRTAIIPDGWVD